MKNASKLLVGFNFILLLILDLFFSTKNTFFPIKYLIYFHVTISMNPLCLKIVNILYDSNIIQTFGTIAIAKCDDSNIFFLVIGDLKTWKAKNNVLNQQIAERI